MTKYYCIGCNCSIDAKVFVHSLSNFEFSLCKIQQRCFKSISAITTLFTLSLFFTYKDGLHHLFNPKQAIADLKRTYFTFLKSRKTLIISNSLNKLNTDKTFDCMLHFLNEKNNKKLSSDYTRILSLYFNTLLKLNIASA